MVGKKHNVQNAVEAGPLRAYVQRILNIEEKQAQLSEDKKVVYAEVKAHGYDTKAVRTAIKCMKCDQEKLREFEEEVKLYVDAIGDLMGTPLGNAAAPRPSMN